MVPDRVGPVPPVMPPPQANPPQVKKAPQKPPPQVKKAPQLPDPDVGGEARLDVPSADELAGPPPLVGPFDRRR